MVRDALVVGINQYPFLKDTPTSKAKHLKTPASDAEAIAQLLEADGNFRVKRLPTSNINGKLQVAPQKAVTADELVDEITKLFLTEDGRDTALLFFAGHGLSKPLGQLKQILLATSDANPQAKRWNGLLLRDLWEIVEQSQVKEQIIWLDSCYSSELLELKDSDFPERVTGCRRLIIAASHSSEVSYERLNGKHGVLSGVLIEGLDPSKILQGDWITDRTLADFVERELKIYYKQTKIPQIPQIRRPDHPIKLILHRKYKQISFISELRTCLVNDKQVYELFRNEEFAEFHFIGLKETPLTVDLVALIKADGLTEKQIVELRDRVFNITQIISYDFGIKPNSRMPNGLLCFVFENECPSYLIDFIKKQTKISHSKRSAVLVTWVIDVKHKQIYTHNNPVSLLPPVVIMEGSVFPGLDYLNHFVYSYRSQLIENDSNRIDLKPANNKIYSETILKFLSRLEEILSQPENRTIKVFLSYSYQDKKLVCQLAKHLSTLEQERVIIVNDSPNVTTEEDLIYTLEKQLNSAQIVLLLVSPDYLNSSFCMLESERIMRQHVVGKVRVVTIILRPLNWDTVPFGKLQALLKNAKPITSWRNYDEAFTDITIGIRRVITEELARNFNSAISESQIQQAFEAEESNTFTEFVVIYGVSFNLLQDEALVGSEQEATIFLSRIEEITDENTYLLQIPHNQSIANELNIILKAPNFQVNGNNTASLPLDPDTSQKNQTARFRLTAFRPGNATITAELYRGDTFETKLETQIQVADIDDATFTPQRITTQPRPVPQPDFILHIQTIWNETNSTCKFQYQLKSFRFPSVFPDNNIYTSDSFSSIWIEQTRGLLATTLENTSGSLPTEGKSRLISLGQYLFGQVFPTELQSDFRSLIPQNTTFTLLILADQEAWIPWELLYDGQRFFAERFIIGRWLQELNDTRPYEFPVGGVNVAHYANVEQPQLWATLLEASGAPLPQPLPAGVLHDSTEAIRGLHLIRYSQSSDAANLRNAPVTLDNINDTEDIELQMRPAKLNLRRNRPFVTLSYLKTDTPELTALENTWASAFIRAGCSGFTGSLWAVEPAVEAAFISCFYNRLWAGASLGEAFYTSRQLARVAAPDSLDWLAYVLFGDPMARPYRPVPGDGYAIVEPIGREIDDPLPPGAIARFRVTLRRNPPVWHEDRVIEVAENLVFENLQVHIVTYGLQVIPDLPITMTLTAKGDYLGWFTLLVPSEITDTSALVQVYFADGMRSIHSLNFSLNIENGREE